MSAAPAQWRARRVDCTRSAVPALDLREHACAFGGALGALLLAVLARIALRREYRMTVDRDSLRFGERRAAQRSSEQTPLMADDGGAAGDASGVPAAVATPRKKEKAHKKSGGGHKSGTGSSKKKKKKKKRHADDASE